MEQERKILVVDDNEAVCATLMELLGDEGYAVTAVTDGAGAFAALVRDRYHLTLLDLVLPDTNGIEILRRIRQDQPATDAIMMTSNASLESALEALHLGAEDYLLKPFDSLEMVLRVVNRTIEKRLLMEDNARLYRELVTKSFKLEQAVDRKSVV